MADVQQQQAPASDPAPGAARTPRRRSHPLLLVLVAAGLAAVIGSVMYFVQVRKPAADNRELNSQLVYNMVGRPGEPIPLKLADRFTDKDGDAVADAPADPAQQIDPPTLTFSYVGTSDPESYRARFAEFVTFLSKQVGRPVEYVPFNSAEDELSAMRQGKLHVAGFNTGNIPLAVNECGFVPVCNLASESGASAYQMQIIVPSDSPIQSLADLRGRELTLTEPGSNSGFKAPLVLLSKEQKLQPGRDFAIRYSQGHRESIAGIASKQYQAAAVASDILKRALAENPPLITQGQFRIIYQSQDFPSAGFGYVHNLKPELAQKIKDAFFAFEWKGTGVEKEFAASEQTKFVPVAFKKDFALIRAIDEAIQTITTSGEGANTDDAPTTAPADAAATQPAGATTTAAAASASQEH